MIEGSAIVYTGGLLDTDNAKTAHGLIRAGRRFRVLGLIDERHAGRPVSEFLPDQPDGLPIRADVDALLAAVTPKTRLLFLANPNNPTGTSMGAADFERLLRELPDHVILVSDEAYYEYVRRPDFPQSLPLIGERPTLVVLRTLSKIYGLAGLRVGYAIGDSELIGYLERARHPFNVSSLAQAAAVAALSDDEHVGRVRELTHRGLERLERGFRELGLSCVPSDANFLLVDVGAGAQDMYERLLRRGVITRPLGAFGLDRHLRVTAGLPEENERLLEALAAEAAR